MEQSIFNKSVPELNKKQVKWQNWRNWFYSNLCDEDRRLHLAKTAIEDVSNEALLKPHLVDRIEKEEQSQKQAHDFYDEWIVPLDIAIKNARRNQDKEALEKTLKTSEDMTKTMNDFFPASARLE